MLEVLERLTREDPDSAWFDDRATPDREDRNKIAIRAFGEAVASLKRRFGEDPTRWAWKHMNKLRIPSLTGEEALGRGGASVPGDTFTVNPGGETGGVSGGASWRMIVDFGDVTRSAGVYPGGQSDDPASPTYDDQIALWATGKYAPLHAVSDAAKLPGAARVKAQRFVP
jgi:penicillin amidase